MKNKLKTLDNLPISKEAVILNINPNCNLRQRLLDLGFVKNTPITALFSAPLGDPIAYAIRGMVISIRKKDSKNIIIDL